MTYGKHVKFSDLKDKVFTSVKQNGDSIIFYLEDGSYYELRHDQECCERVYIESIVGDLNDLVNTPITFAVEETNEGERISEYDDHYTWTFYKLASIKGYVDIRFYGSSNGYYGESADLYYYKELE